MPYHNIIQFSSVQSVSCVRLFATPWIEARRASLSITNSWSSLRLTSIIFQKNLLFCLCCVLAVAHGIFTVARELLINSCRMHAGSSSLIRDWTWAPRIMSMHLPMGPPGKSLSILIWLCSVTNFTISIVGSVTLEKCTGHFCNIAHTRLVAIEMERRKMDLHGIW